MTPAEIVVWRRERRRELLAVREALGAATRAAWGRNISRSILQGLPLLAGGFLGIYWPFRGEFDPRFVARALRLGGAGIGLPVVVARDQPLIFREWHPGSEMLRGGLDIPYPASGDIKVPDACVIPPVGFDRRGYRLGYGAGFFDRTLAAMSPRPLAVGVAFECARMETIFPQRHDIALDFVVTENGIYLSRASGLERIALKDANQLAVELVGARRRAHCAAGAPDGGSYSSPVCYAREVAPGYFGEEPGTD